MIRDRASTYAIRIDMIYKIYEQLQQHVKRQIDIVDYAKVQGFYIKRDIKLEQCQ